jgi:hypothetical protein
MRRLASSPDLTREFQDTIPLTRTGSDIVDLMHEAGENACRCKLFPKGYRLQQHARVKRNVTHQPLVQNSCEPRANASDPCANFDTAQ